MIDIKTLACGPKHLVLRAIAAHRNSFMDERPRAIYMSQESIDDLVEELVSEHEMFTTHEKIDGLMYCGTQIRVGDAQGYPFMLCINGSACYL